MIARRVRLTLACTAGMALALGATAAQAQQRRFSIPSEDARQSIPEFGRQAGIQISAPTGRLRGVRTPAIQGNMDAREALRRLLAGTGLEVASDTGSMIILRERALGTSGESQAGSAAANSESAENAGEILVTGTRIAGVRTPAPSIRVTREEMENSGQRSLQDFFEDLPQNFNSLTPSGAKAEGTSAISQSNQNYYTSAADLRGLGPESTLTLLNGSRVGGSFQGRVVDLSNIPLAVVDSVDVVTGGASAVYGADAVGGVVNIHTRENFNGFGATALVSTPTDYDSGAQWEVSGIAGVSDQGGGLVLAYDYLRQHPLDLVKTGVVAVPNISGISQLQLNVSPDVERHVGYLSAHRRLTSGIELRGTALYTDQVIKDVNRYIASGAVNPTIIDGRLHVREYFASMNLNIQIAPWLSFVTDGTYSTNSTQGRFNNHFDFGSLVVNSTSTNRDNSKQATISSYLSAELPEILHARAALVAGAEYRSERFIGFTNTLQTGGSRNVKSVFGELRLPFFASQGHSALVEFSLAGRYDDYGGYIGDTFNPQFGAIVRPVRGLTLRAAYSTSFRAPANVDISPRYSASILNRKETSGTNTPVLFLNGQRANLRPERSRSFSTGFDFEPSFLNGLRLSVDYFQIHYRDRLDFPAQGTDVLLILQREALFPGLLNRAPTVADVSQVLSTVTGSVRNSSGRPWNPASGATGLLAAIPNLVIFDNRYNNIAIEKVNGIDVNIQDRKRLGRGELMLGLNGSYVFGHSYNLTATSPTVARLNDVGKPVDFRLRASAAYRQGPVQAAIYANYTDSYRNTLGTTDNRIGSWTTFDLSLRYAINRRTSITLSATNIFNTDPPPFLENQDGLLYDSANANAVGRSVALRFNTAF